MTTVKKNNFPLPLYFGWVVDISIGSGQGCEGTKPRLFTNKPSANVLSNNYFFPSP